MMNLKTKKADLTANQIITIVILIVSFAIILLFFFMLNLGGNIDKESCRNSVVLRGSLPAGAAAIQLQCKTQEVCIYKSGNCENMGGDALKIKATNSDEIAEALADLMYDCNWQMGGGKIDYLPGNFGKDRNYCSICNMIYFDDAIKNDASLNKLTVQQLYRTLQIKKSGESSNSMLFDIYGVNSMDSALSAAGVTSNNYFDLSKKEGYVLLTSLTKEGLFKMGNLIAIGVGLFAGALTGGNPIVGGAVTAIGFAIAGPEGTTYVPPMLTLNVKSNLEKWECEEFTNLAS